MLSDDLEIDNFHKLLFLLTKIIFLILKRLGENFIIRNTFKVWRLSYDDKKRIS
jgi:hypothetical protein